MEKEKVTELEGIEDKAGKETIKMKRKQRRKYEIKMQQTILSLEREEP